MYVGEVVRGGMDFASRALIGVRKSVFIRKYAFLTCECTINR